MVVLRFLYQWIIVMPIMVVITIMTALITIIGCFLGNHRVWGYYPGLIWSRLFCLISLVRIEVRGREKLDRSTSYVFVANHQGAYDIFLIYGYLGHKFKWMMKSSLRRIPFVGAACAAAGFIFVDRSGKFLRAVCRWSFFPKGRVHPTVRYIDSKKELIKSPMTFLCLSFR